MKQITFITTTASCDDTFDKISRLNNGFSSETYKSDIIVLNGNFKSDVFMWVDSENNPSYQRYADYQKHTEITEDRYDDMLEVLPPIYITHVDGNKVKSGFCVSEPYTHLNNGGVVLTTCYKLDGKYYMCLCAAFKYNDNAIKDTYNAEYTRDNYCITYTK